MLNGTAANRVLRLTVAILLATTGLALETQAQSTYDVDRERAMQLLNESRVSEALPLLERLAKEQPNDATVTFGLGFCLLAKANTDPNIAARKGKRKEAREVLQRAKELGFDHPLLHSILEAVRPDGENAEKFSHNKEADAAMQAGEAAFVQGDLNQALAHYKRALELDPQLYEAALFTGDMYNKKGEPESGSEWFARAVAINPNRETAYRYWGVGLIKQGKMLEARDKFVDAYISEPFNRLAINNLVEWARLNEVTVDHPRIDIPASVSSTGPGETSIAIDERALDKFKHDGSAAWMMYGLRRSVWANGGKGLSEKFAKAYPAEKEYRHSLAEEVDGLRGAIESVSVQMKDKGVTQLESSLALLVKLNDAGLLEAYVLLAHPDKGIVRDYPEYRRTNREKLRRYVTEYVLVPK